MGPRLLVLVLLVLLTLPFSAGGDELTTDPRYRELLETKRFSELHDALVELIREGKGSPAVYRLLVATCIAMGDSGRARRIMTEQRIGGGLEVAAPTPEVPVPAPGHAASPAGGPADGNDKRTIIGYASDSGGALHQLASCARGKSHAVREGDPDENLPHCKRCWE